MSSNVIVALSLLILTVIRLPTISIKEARPALWAAGLATAGFTIYVEEVYYAVDPILGGGNHVGFAMAELVVAAFWQLHKSVVTAALWEDRPALKRQLTRCFWAWVLTASIGAVGFLTSDVPVTSQSLVWTYGSQPGIALMFGALACFIAYVGVGVGVAAFRNLSGMSALFRAGFCLVGIGCLAAVLLLGGRGVISLWDKELISSPVIRSVYGSGQVLAVLCVAVGLSLSRLVVVARLTSEDVMCRQYLFRIIPLWTIVTEGQGDTFVERLPFTFADAFKRNPYTRLQRRVTEIHDCMRLGGGRDRRISSKQLVVLAKAERVLRVSR